MSNDNSTAAPAPYDPQSEGAHMDFDGEMSYADYLGLDAILGAQSPLTDTHDEMLFIIQHQTSELWMRLVLHEVAAARVAIANDQLETSFKMLSRVSRIFDQLTNAWNVLRTMTPTEYSEFRDALGQSSGFQSYQYRLIEFVVGNRNSAMIRPHAHNPEIAGLLESELTKPSLYDEAIRVLSRGGFEISDQVLNRDVSQVHVVDDSVVAAWGRVYENPEQYWSYYDLAEKLVDLEDYFRRWRFNHVTTVERIIGFKRGTGGTGGVPYLRRMLDVVLFPELWEVRTIL